MKAKFQATHVIMTQANKARTNGVVHCFKFGTEVEWLTTVGGMVKVVNDFGTVQFVELSDLRVSTL